MCSVLCWDILICLLSHLAFFFFFLNSGSSLIKITCFLPFKVEIQTGDIPENTLKCLKWHFKFIIVVFTQIYPEKAVKMRLDHKLVSSQGYVSWSKAFFFLRLYESGLYVHFV